MAMTTWDLAHWVPWHCVTIDWRRLLHCGALTCHGLNRIWLPNAHEPTCIQDQGYDPTSSGIPSVRVVAQAGALSGTKGRSSQGSIGDTQPAHAFHGGIYCRELLTQYEMAERARRDTEASQKR